MDEKTAAKLVSLNSEFYQTFAAQFSSTRMRLQSGVQRILEILPSDANILDLGCGSGELARKLAARGFEGSYLGLDFSAGLLEIAREGVEGTPKFSFIQGDLGTDGWDESVISHQSSVISNDFQFPIPNFQFSIILAFATFHHLPGRGLQRQTFRKISNLLSPGGGFIHSNWQFLNSERLRRRIQPWSEIGLTADDIDPGDYLLDWRQGGRGLRYVHHFTEDELAILAEETGFKIIETFFSDGEGGNLGLYQTWQHGDK